MYENGILLKKSQFNYTIQDEFGNILIYNFAKGMSSFCRIIKSDVEAYLLLINSSAIQFDSNNKSLVSLVEKGILVPKDYDELLTVNGLYNESAMDSKVRLIIMPTEQCNFRCKYCYESYQKGEMTEENQKTLLKFLQRKISSTSKIQISWFGGEPIEAIHVVQRIMEYANRMCDKQNVQLISDMTTNAYNLDDVNFDMLYNLRVFSYQVTLDGLEEQHNKQRVLKNGNGTFEKIVNNLLYIKNNYQKYKLANVSIRVNMSRDILNHFSEFIDFYRKNFGNDRRFTLGLTPISDMGGTVVNEIKDRFIDVSEIYTAINNINLYDDNSIQFSNIMRAFSPKESLCYASKKNTYVIGSDLSLYKCTVHFEMNENKIGRIAPNGEEIVDELIHRRWYVNYHFKEKCKSCFLLPTCYGGGCPHKRVFAEENLKKCVLSTWKNEIGNAIKYVLKRNDIETIKFN